MASDSDRLDHIFYHRSTGAWIQDHGGEGQLISFHVPAPEIEEEEKVGAFFPKNIKFTDPRKVGVVYLYILGPHLDPMWRQQSDGTKTMVIKLSDDPEFKSARNVIVDIQQKKPRPPSRNDTNTPTQPFPTMDINVKVGNTKLPQQNFTYPAFFRLNAPTVGKPSLHLLWGRYNAENPSIFAGGRGNKAASDKEPYTWLTVEGLKDKYAIQMATSFRNAKDPFSENGKLAQSGLASILTIDPGDQIDKYKQLASLYFNILNTVGKNVADKKIFAKTHLRFIADQIEQSQ